MTLPSDLVSQFAKITHDGGIKKEETILYGTVVQYGDSLCVRLDGSNEITPAVTTSTIKAGDRVSVTLKKHTAIITGNLSDPAASGDDVEKVKLEITDMGVVFTGLADGTTIINGGCIKTGTIDAERISLKGLLVYEYSVDGETDWHSPMAASDMYRRESIDGGKTFGAPYQFRGKDGQDGSDADVPSYVELKGLDFTDIRNNYIRSPKIYGGEFYGNEFNVVSDGSDGAFNLYGDYNGSQYHFLSIYYYNNGTPHVFIESPSGATIHIDGNIHFHGNVDFGEASVSGL